MSRLCVASILLSGAAAQAPSPFPPTPTPTPDYLRRRRSTPGPSPSPDTPETVTAWHLFERKYTGLAQKDGGDFLGDTSFIFSTFAKYNSRNPEASIEANIIEMSSVNVTGWGRYTPCNAPGCTTGGSLSCPADSADYCCIGEEKFTNTTLPGRAAHSGGYWYSFPRISQGVTWTEQVLRRVNGSCVGNAWRVDAGGCHDCGEELDQCVARCIQSNLDTTELQATWDRAFNDTAECPDLPFPGPTTVVV